MKDLRKQLSHWWDFHYQLTIASHESLTFNRQLFSRKTICVNLIPLLQNLDSALTKEISITFFPQPRKKAPKSLEGSWQHSSMQNKSSSRVLLYNRCIVQFFRKNRIKKRNRKVYNGCKSLLLSLLPLYWDGVHIVSTKQMHDKS